MKGKAKIYSLVKIILAAALILALLPTVFTRVSNESRNKSVVVSLLYNDIKMKLSAKDLDEQLDEYRKLGVNTVTVQEEDLNSLISSGTVTCLKYNVLLHKYEEENEEMIAQLRDLPDITNDSYILITKRDASKALLAQWIPLKYADDEYDYMVTAEGADMYVLYDGTPYTYQISVGYNESDLKYLHDKGFDISLDSKVKNYAVQGYIDEYDRLIKEYGVKYLSVRDDNYRHPKKETDAKANYEGISKLIQANNLVLVVNENPDQLSNEKPIGYKTIFNDNSDKVIRAYETYYIPGGDPTEYMFRYNQHLNSTIDRNIRFITVTQVINPMGTHMEQNVLTQKAVKEYITKINSLGYDTKNFYLDYDYTVNRRLVSAIALVLMAIMLLTMIEWLAQRIYRPLTILAIIGSVLGVAATFVLPMSLIELYPSLFALLAPCFALTAVFMFVSEHGSELKTNISRGGYIVGTMALALALMLLCGLVQGALLSGIDYYINYSIFRGIKLSLYAPLLFAMLAFYLIFMKKQNMDIIGDMRKVLISDIKVYWIVIALVFLYVGKVYITRSGNVNTISGLEEAFRSAITDAFPARPRTKELFAWPCLMLFIYYTRVRRVPLFSFLFSVGGAIVFASIMNSFCHVFTNLSTIYSRVFVGVLLSIFICIGVYVLNKIFLWAAEKILRFVGIDYDFGKSHE
ncbi:MAG: hypothetical protein J1F63_06650 [Oscillospiraceae bacterium]|nr:hypothetical protein [Oscillospiraceae bacterium]